MWMLTVAGTPPGAKNENECAYMMRAIRSNVFALKHSHIRHQIVEIPIAVPRGVCAGWICERCEAVEVGDHTRLCIGILRRKHVNNGPVWQSPSTRDGDGLRQSPYMMFFRIFTVLRI